jgi:hypothetical protein
MKGASPTDDAIAALMAAILSSLSASRASVFPASEE